MPSADKTALQVGDVTKRFGGLTAVKNLSLDLRAGEIFGLIGPNGSGKSTIFNMLSGTLAPSAGSIEFAGAEIAVTGAVKSSVPKEPASSHLAASTVSPSGKPSARDRSANIRRSNTSPVAWS